MAPTEASSGHLTRPAGDVPGRHRLRGTRRSVSDRLPWPWLFPLLAYGATLVLIVVTWQVANAIYGSGEPWTFYFLFKDAAHYLEIAQSGYPSKLVFPPPVVHHPYNPFYLVNLPSAYNPLITYKTPVPPAPYPYLPAFFPAWPGLIWLLHWVTLGNWLAGGLLASILSGAAASLGVWAVADRVADRVVADRAVVAFCVFPGAMTFGMLYSEPLAIAIAAAALLAMLDRRWLLAGLLAAVGTAERPTLLVLTGVLGVGAIVAIWERREWRALVAAPLSLAGLALFFGWLGHRYHDVAFWFATEKHGWAEKIDGGEHTLKLLLWRPSSGADKYPFYTILLTIMLAAGIAGIAFMIRRRLPWQLTLFTVLTLLACLVSNAQSSKPRFVWSAFGIFIGLAAVNLPRWLFWTVVAVSAGLLFFLVGWWPHHYVGPAP
jgi:Glycosyltransferase family 87